MKIGIITFHRAHNYGAVLQAFAMKAILSRYGQADIIDYWPDYHRSDYKLLDFRFLEKDLTLMQRMVFIRGSIKRLILLPLRLVRHGKFKRFIKNYFLCSDKTTAKNESQLPQDYDAYVYGSDQIWRVYDMKNYPRPDLVYLGSGIPEASKKVSYAASMGSVNNSTLQDPKVMELLARFDFLSVRESTLKEAISKISSLSVTQVLDPTLLVSRSEWNELSNNAPTKMGRPYLLYYSLIDSPEARYIANKLAHDLDLIVIEINGFETIKGLFNKSLTQTAGPIDFLQLIKNADFVVSTSFHGVVFSLIFHKQFYACGMKHHSDRVKSLLNLLNIDDRLIEDNPPSTEVQIIDFNDVDSRLDALIADSELFIRTALSKNDDQTRKVGCV